MQSYMRRGWFYVSTIKYTCIISIGKIDDIKTHNILYLGMFARVRFTVKSAANDNLVLDSSAAYSAVERVVNMYFNVFFQARVHC